MSTQNEKSLPVEMSYAENQLLKTAVVFITAYFHSDPVSAAMAAERYAKLAEKIGNEAGQKFFDRMTDHAAATKPEGESSDDLPPEVGSLAAILAAAGVEVK